MAEKYQNAGWYKIYFLGIFFLNFRIKKKTPARYGQEFCMVIIIMYQD